MKIDTNNRKLNKKKTQLENDNYRIDIISAINNFLLVAFYSVVLLILDLIFFINFKSESVNLPTIVFLDLGIGLFFSFLLFIPNKVLRTAPLVIADAIFIAYGFFEFVEIAINRIVGNAFTFLTIILNYKSVISQYEDEISSAFSQYKFELLLFFIAVLVFVLLSKMIYLGKAYDGKKQNTIILPIITLILSIVFTFLGIIFINKNVFDFESNMRTNGLKVAMYLDAMPSNAPGIIDAGEESESVEQNEVVNNEIYNIATSSNIATKSIINKPYYYDTEKYNVINFDFDEIISNEDRKDFNAINEFIKNRVPTAKNEYTGLFKGKNLIMICAESWNSKIVDEQLFPTMHRLINNGFKLNNFYQPHGSSSTSSGEYAFMTGMISVKNDRSFLASVNNNMGFTISMKLKDEDYNTYSFHNGRSNYYGRDETHESFMGFDKFTANDTGLNQISKQQVTDDTNLIKIMYDKVKNNQPFLSYMMTYNGHKPYIGDMPKKTDEYYRIVKSIYKKRYSDPVKHYIAKNLYLEEGLKYLIEKLEEDDLINDTVICMVPDHYPYGLINASEQKNDNVDYLLDFYKDPRINVDTSLRDRTDIILWCGSLENSQKSYVKQIDKVTNTIDLTPTLLNLFGIEYDSRLYPGQDIFSNSKGRAIYQNGMYVNDSLKGKYIPAGISEKDDKEIFEIYNLINYCKFNIKNDYYGYLTNGKSTKQKTCYLTFDGGPTDNTSKILKILKEKNIKATFFVTGAMKLSIIFDIVSDKHTLGIQSYFKNYKKIYSSDIAFVEDFYSVYNKISEIYNGDKIKYMRFYGGSNNKIGEKVNPGGMNRAIDFVYSLGLNYVDWNVDSGDINNISKDEIIQNVLNGIEGLNDICILFHDDTNNSATVEALPEIIDELEKRGYRMKKIADFSKLFHLK